MAVQDIIMDGLFRPERSLRDWQVVAYIRHYNPDRLERRVDGTPCGGKAYPTYFTSEAQAQARCDVLNKK